MFLQQDPRLMSSRSLFARFAAALALAMVLFLPSRAALAEWYAQSCPSWTAPYATTISPEETARLSGLHAGGACAAGGWSCLPRALGATGKDYVVDNCVNSQGCTAGPWGDQQSSTHVFGVNNYCASTINGKNAGKPECPDCKAGNPINGGTNNKYQVEVDFASNGGLEFVRTYNSGLPGDRGVLGSRWRHNWDRTVFDAVVTAQTFRGDGKRYRYLPPSSGTVWTTDPDVLDRLEKLGDGTWRLTTAANEVELYDTNGRLQSVTSAAGDVFRARLAHLAPGRNRGRGLRDNELRFRRQRLAHQGDNA